MKKIITLALLALSLGGYAQQRQLVKQQDYNSRDNRSEQEGRDKRYTYGNYSFSRLDLTSRQERQLVMLLKDKQQEQQYILRKFRNPDAKLRLLDREYDRKIQSLMSRSQFDKWTRIYAYQYEAYGAKRWS